MPVSVEMQEFLELLKLVRKDRASDEQLERLAELRGLLQGELFGADWEAESSAA